MTTKMIDALTHNRNFRSYSVERSWSGRCRRYFEKYCVQIISSALKHMREHFVRCCENFACVAESWMVHMWEWRLSTVLIILLCCRLRISWCIGRWQTYPLSLPSQQVHNNSFLLSLLLLSDQSAVLIEHHFPFTWVVWST